MSSGTPQTLLWLGYQSQRLSQAGQAPYAGTLSSLPWSRAPCTQEGPQGEVALRWGPSLCTFLWGLGQWPWPSPCQDLGEACHGALKTQQLSELVHGQLPALRVGGWDLQASIVRAPMGLLCTCSSCVTPAPSWGCCCSHTRLPRPPRHRKGARCLTGWEGRRPGSHHLNLTALRPAAYASTGQPAPWAAAHEGSTWVSSVASRPSTECWG